MSREGEAEEGGSRPFRSFVASERARARIEESSVTRTGPPRARSMEVRGSQPRTTRGRILLTVDALCAAEKIFFYYLIGF